MKQSKRSTFKLLFYVKKNSVKKDGSAPLMGRITINGKVAQFSAKLNVSPENWDLTYGRMSGRNKEALAINQRLDAIRVRINNCYNDLMDKDGFATALKVKNTFLGIRATNNSLLSVFKEHNSDFDKMVGKTRSRRTYVMYHTAYVHLEAFVLSRYKHGDIDFKELDATFIHDFEMYMRTEKKLETNSIALYLKSLKRVAKLAIQKEIIHKNPFINYQIKKQEKDRGYLTKEEIERLGNTTLDTEQQLLVRDMFLFSCFTGLAYIDVKNLKEDDVQHFFDGNTWLLIRRKKTNTASPVRLLDIPLKILEKYKGTAPNGYVFPMPTNHSCNGYLRKIAKKAKIDKRVTFHMARHSFATMLLSENVPIESVSKMMGHKNITTTQIYAKITNQKISRDMDCLAERLKSIENNLITTL